MIALVVILIVLGVILLAAVLLLFLGNASIRVATTDKLRVTVSVCGIPYTLYPEKKDAPKKPKNLARCRNPERILQRELRRQQRAEEKARRKKERAARRAARRTEKKTGVPQKYCPAPNLKENLEMILALLKRLYYETRGKVKLRIKKLHILVAADDAAHTALLYGVVLQLVSYMIGFVERNYSRIDRKEGDLMVGPDYVSDECSIDVDIVLSVKIWRAIPIIMKMSDAYDREKKRTYRKAALREREQLNKPRFKIKNILTQLRKDHSLWKTNLLSRK